MSSRMTLFGEVPQDWTISEVGEIADLRQGLQISKKLRVDNTVQDSIPLLKITDLPTGVFSEYVKDIPENYIASKEDIIYTRTGQVGLVYTNVEGCVHNNCFKVIVDYNKFDKNYIYYYLKSDNVYKYSNSVAGGSVQKDLTHGAFKKCKIAFPSLREQRKIGNILIELDKKIETNNEINKKLEEMAQAIFKQWFVDFEFPNEAGEPYKSSGGEMVESELGMIPKGWNIGCFREFTDTVLGGDWGKETEQGNYKKEVLCLRGADIPEIKSGKVGVPAKRFILEKNYSNKKLNDGDLVVEISGGSPTQSTGRITYINEGILNRYDLDFVCTNFCRAITLNNKKALEYFYFYWIYLYNSNVFFQYENGTTGIKNFDVNTFLDKHQIVKPSTSLLEKYHEIVSNLLNIIQRNGLENTKLSNTRDLLLPKLMSGEIRVDGVNIGI